MAILCWAAKNCLRGTVLWFTFSFENSLVTHETNLQAVLICREPGPNKSYRRKWTGPQRLLQIQVFVEQKTS